MRNRFLPTIMVVIFLVSWVSCTCSPTKTNDAALNGTTTTSEARDEFSARLVDGKDFNSVEYKDQRLLLGFFSITHKDSLPMLKAMEGLLANEKKYNYKVIGVSINADNPKGVLEFVKSNNIVFPVLVEEASLALAGKFKIENEVAFIGLGADHKLTFGIKKYVFADIADGERQFVEFVREGLGIKGYQPLEPRLGEFKQAPDFAAKTFAGKQFELSGWRGKAVLLVFFSPKCPHCQHELEFVRDDLYPAYHAKGLEVMGVSMVALKEEALTIYDGFKLPWPVIEDVSGRAIRKLYSTTGSVPQSFLIDKEGRVVFTSVGYSPKSSDLYHMYVRGILGLDNPPRLATGAYSGEKTCQVCHLRESVEWTTTAHARAWKGLVFIGKDRDETCVACHSVGFNQKGGFEALVGKTGDKKIVIAPEALQNVQCENCHGQGGPHQTKQAKPDMQAVKQTCLTCHTQERSPKFDFEKMLPLVNHSRAAEIMKMPLQERLQLAGE